MLFQRMHDRQLGCSRVAEQMRDALVLEQREEGRTPGDAVHRRPDFFIHVTTVRFGSTISNMRGNSSISAISSPSFMGLPVNPIFPAAIASGNVACFAMTASSTERGRVKLASAFGDCTPEA